MAPPLEPPGGRFEATFTPSLAHLNAASYAFDRGTIKSGKPELLKVGIGVDRPLSSYH